MLGMFGPCLRKHPHFENVRCVDVAGHGGAHMAHAPNGTELSWSDEDDGLRALAAREATNHPAHHGGADNPYEAIKGSAAGGTVTDLDALKEDLAALRERGDLAGALTATTAELHRLIEEVERLRYALDVECANSLVLQARVTMLDRADRLNTLQVGYEEGVDEERAAVVAWLRDMGQDCRLMGRIREGEAVAYYANLIERGEHRREEEK